MDVLFGAITQEERDADIARHAAAGLKGDRNSINEEKPGVNEQVENVAYSQRERV
jgi:hypothetical protein